jgi:hypothetical protein
MSDVANTPLKPNAKRDTRTDNQAFAQVEKWMAMIREIDREPQPERKHAD